MSASTTLLRRSCPRTRYMLTVDWMSPSSAYWKRVSRTVASGVQAGRPDASGQADPRPSRESISSKSCATPPPPPSPRAPAGLASERNCSAEAWSWSVAALSSCDVS